MVDNCAGSLIWWLVGYAFAYGEDLFGIGFIGGKHGYFFAANHFDDTPNSYRDCFF
jgi:ammonia channel protein AmtB